MFGKEVLTERVYFFLEQRGKRKKYISHKSKVKINILLWKWSKTTEEWIRLLQGWWGVGGTERDES